MRLDERADRDQQTRRHGAVAIACRLADDELSSYELRARIRDLQSQQVVGAHPTCRPARATRRSTRHADKLAPSVIGASRDDADGDASIAAAGSGEPRHAAPPVAPADALRAARQ